MSSTSGSKMSKRRVKLLTIFLSFSTVLSALVLLLGIGLQNKIIIYSVFPVVLVYIVAIIYLSRKPEISRNIYAFTYVMGVFVCSSLFGRAAGIELYFTFYYLLVFILFSYRREKIKIIIFTFFATVAWILLIYFDFDLFNYKSISPYQAATYIYPLTFVGNFILILLTLIQFSYENSKMFQKQQENKNKALELLDLKTNFLNAIDERIREPLNSIIGLTDLLTEENPREDQKSNIASLKSSSKNLLELLNNVLNIGKSEKTDVSLHSKPNNLSVILHEIKNIYQPSCKEKNIDFNLKIADDFPVINLDKLRYSQIVNNLISNALKFTHKGGITIEITIKEQSEDSITFTTKVTDTGIGIPSDKIEVIWEKFTQASATTTKLYGGTGLGLSIVKNIVATMGSSIQLSSEENKGSSFYFDLTRAIVPDKIEEVISIEENNQLAGKKILITDDNAVNILVLKQILNKQKVHIREATNGKEAVDILTTEKFDMILMDLNMPVMDGYNSIVEIRKFNKNTPILILTASKIINLDKLKDLNISGFVYKPFEPKELLNQINQFI